MDYEITGKLIRNARKRKGLTQEQLAEMVNLSTMSIRRYERGERIVPDDKLQAIVEILGDSFYDSLSQYIDETPQRLAKRKEIWERQQEEEDAEFRRKVVEEAQEDIKSFELFILFFTDSAEKTPRLNAFFCHLAGEC